MADDAAGAVRRTPRPAPAVPELWWSPTTGLYRQTRYAGLNRILTSEHRQVIGGVPHDALPNDAARLVLDDPETRRPVVLLRADDCDCGPPYADCPHGPEPVDALDLVMWLYAEAQWQRDQLDAEALRWTDTAGKHAEEVERLEGRVTQLEEQVEVGHRVQLAVAGQWLGHAADQLGEGPEPEYLQRLAEWLTNGTEGDEPEPQAALQGDQPTEPRHELVLKSGLSGCTGACSCGTWHGGGRHEPPSRVAYRWDAEHLASLPLEQPTGEADRG